MTINGAITQLVMMTENSMMPNVFRPALNKVIETISELEPQPQLSNNSLKLDNENGDLISREEILKLPQRKGYAVNGWETYIRVSDIKELPSTQQKQRYTKEELKAFQHGIILSSMAKQSSQRWHYNKDTAAEIEFLERLYEKVGVDMRGEVE